jgi:hypothetical protein
MIVSTSCAAASNVHVPRSGEAMKDGERYVDEEIMVLRLR